MISKKKTKQFDWLTLSYIKSIISENNNNYDRLFTYVTAKDDFDSGIYYLGPGESVFIVNCNILTSDVLKELFRD